MITVMTDDGHRDAGAPPTVDVAGVLLAYRVAGDPAAPPMVLLHGLGEAASAWEPVLPALAATHRVYAVDLRGHGRSARPGRYSFAVMRDDVIGFLDAVGVHRCVLIGHSAAASSRCSWPSRRRTGSPTWSWRT